MSCLLITFIDHSNNNYYTLLSYRIFHSGVSKYFAKKIAKYHYPHFTDREVEAWRGPKAHPKSLAELAGIPKHPICQACALPPGSCCLPTNRQARKIRQSNPSLQESEWIYKELLFSHPQLRILCGIFFTFF